MTDRPARANNIILFNLLEPKLNFDNEIVTDEYRINNIFVDIKSN